MTTKNLNRFVAAVICLLQLCIATSDDLILSSNNTADDDLTLTSHSSVTIAATTPCLNNSTYKYTLKKKSFSCKKIRFREDRRLALCQVAEVSAQCPQTCGKCCDDDPTYVFPLKWKSSKLQNCFWISRNTLAKEYRRSNFCNGFNTYNGSTIRNKCPNACGVCKSEVAVVP